MLIIQKQKNQNQIQVTAHNLTYYKNDYFSLSTLGFCLKLLLIHNLHWVTLELISLNCLLSLYGGLR